VGAILIQGVGFALLFVPLTTAAISTIPRHQLSDATGLNSLLRQVGGSFGLAIFATLLRRSQVEAGASISATLTRTRPEVMSRLQAVTQGLISRGLDVVGAHTAALQVMGFTISRQAAVLAFEKMFLLSGIAFLAVLPLLIFLKVERHGGGHKPEVHMEL
jgi:DHA2 family multidrug resistance protein